MAEDPHNLGDELRIAVESIVCPHCDSDLARIARVLSPDKIEKSTMETWTRLLGGTGVGATAGAIGGPIGVMMLGLAGGTAGGWSAIRRRELARTILDCPECGYHGNALDESLEY